MSTCDNSTQKGVDLAEELRPRGLILPEEMVAAGERHEPGTGDQRCEVACLLQGHPQLISRVQHESWRFHECGVVGDVDLAPRFQQPCCVLRRGRPPEQLRKRIP